MARVGWRSSCRGRRQLPGGSLRLKRFGQIFLDASASTGVPPGRGRGGGGAGREGRGSEVFHSSSPFG